MLSDALTECERMFYAADAHSDIREFAPVKNHPILEAHANLEQT